MNFEFYLYSELLIDVIKFTPERAAPFSSNPDSPSYSDCGSDAEYEDYKVYVEAYGEKIDITDKISEKLGEILHNKILMHGESQYADYLMEKNS